MAYASFGQGVESEFDITRPMFGDLGSCRKTATCTRQVDGTAQHNGVELTLSTPLPAQPSRGMWMAV